MLTVQRMLVPLAIVIAGVAVAIGVAVSGRGGAGSARDERQATAPAAEIVSINAEEAGDRFGSLAATRRIVASPDAVSSTSCAAPDKTGVAKCIVTFRRFDQVGGERFEKALPLEPRLYEVQFSSSDDLGPRYTELGAPTREDDAAIRGDRSALKIKEPGPVDFDGSEACSPRFAVKNLTCEEAMRLADDITQLSESEGLGVENFRCGAVDGDNQIVSCVDGKREFRYSATA